MDKIYYSEMDTPIGPLTMVSKNDILILLEYGAFDERKTSIISWCEKHSIPTNLERNVDAHILIHQQLNEYFSKKRKSFTIPYVCYGTPFQQKVWKALTDVPFGETKSYKDIAEAVESPKAVRAVGGANNKNPISIIVPCHRIIGMNGKLVGYGGGIDKKVFLLDLERESED
ncbi:methylated-DNA--[protein]-cysteine S-methyltransferase [Gracilibacillus marinus]|jgi:methylated-DNA-[protein]-cysteine S-methyltransferase|uniref:Methylated-DNA--protein-cysteine methyltransferase n=1 Tax=Gracilibacillus marinus TaxID=630535 RepID=A0ABV8VYD0_9BACI